MDAGKSRACASSESVSEPRHGLRSVVRRAVLLEVESNAKGAELRESIQCKDPVSPHGLEAIVAHLLRRYYDPLRCNTNSTAWRHCHCAAFNVTAAVILSVAERES